MDHQIDDFLACVCLATFHQAIADYQKKPSGELRDWILSDGRELVRLGYSLGGSTNVSRIGKRTRVKGPRH